MQNFLALDNARKRRQLEQPPPNVSTILDELVRENISAQRRQLSTLRFRQINADQHSLYNDLVSAIASSDAAGDADVMDAMALEPVAIDEADQSFIDQVHQLFRQVHRPHFVSYGVNPLQLFRNH